MVSSRSTLVDASARCQRYAKLNSGMGFALILHSVGAWYPYRPPPPHGSGANCWYFASAQDTSFSMGSVSVEDIAEKVTALWKICRSVEVHQVSDSQNSALD